MQVFLEYEINDCIGIRDVECWTIKSAKNIEETKCKLKMKARSHRGWMITGMDYNTHSGRFQTLFFKYLYLDALKPKNSCLLLFTLITVVMTTGNVR